MDIQDMAQALDGHLSEHMTVATATEEAAIALYLASSVALTLSPFFVSDIMKSIVHALLP